MPPSSIPKFLGIPVVISHHTTFEDFILLRPTKLSTQQANRQQAIDDPDFLTDLYAQICGGMDLSDQILLAGSEVMVAIDEDVIILLYLQMPWLMEASHRESFDCIAEGFRAALGIEHIGICCEDDRWAAINRGGTWIVIEEGDFELEIATLAPIVERADSEPHCKGIGCEWSSCCALHLAYQLKPRKSLNLITPDPETCQEFVGADVIYPQF